VTAPASTYRVQLGGDTTFERVARLAPYLERLGVGAVYLSPILRARFDSTHNYDVTDPARIDERFGGREGFTRMARVLRRRGIGLVVDVVPNHMAMDRENPWWMDVLEHGRASRYARFFDIDWRGTGVEGKVLVPVLGRPYGDALEAGELRLVLEDGGLRVAYFDQRLPVDPAHYARVLDGVDGEAVRAVVERSRAMSPRSRTDARTVSRRAREAEAIKRDLGRVHAEDRAARAAVDRTLRSWSGRPGAPSSFDRLDALLGDQAYTVSYWRSGLYEIDYRRFFDIPDLVSLAQEDPDVFEATHALVLRLVARGEVDGVRVDHVDGLLDPAAYAARLRGRVGHGYLVVEKILGRDESLPGWPVDGTTGYEFLRDVVEVLVDAEGARRLEDAFAERTADDRPFDRAVVDAKLEVIRALFASETAALTRWLQELAREDRHARDVPAAPLREAIELVTAELDVYRTYVRTLDVSRQDRARIEGALERAGTSAGTDAAVALAFLRRVLLLEGVRSLAPERAAEWMDFVMRWQQLSGPVTAKGLEDTALYRRVAFVALNDVGVHPVRDPADVAAFHARIRARARACPRTMLTTATHDTKRGEDTRARLAVLSELAPGWLDAVDRWSSWNRRHATTIDGVRAPDVAEEWLLYQTIVSIWPADGRAGDELVDRVVAYMTKAMREAKRTTGWLEPDEAHEAAVERFARAILGPRTRFRRDVAAFAERVAWHGALNSLSQLVLKLTAPGVPDVYQGTELWDLTLVDPDNRRPVDFDARETTLGGGDGLAAVPPEELLAGWRDGRVKMAVLARLLAFRREHPELFLEGDHVPVAVEGPRADHVIAFERRRGRERALVVVARLTVGVAREDGRPPRLGSATLRLPGGRTRRRDIIGERDVELTLRMPVDAVLERLPVAVLVER
jgi:(1->4)-alpha-D-glucan 1-alpha-D-glucosylmutase